MSNSIRVNFSMSLIILVFPCILAIFYPHVGKLAGVTGALGGLLTIYVLPTITYL
jgi:hypothetical protein